MMRRIRFWSDDLPWIFLSLAILFVGWIVLRILTG